MKKYLLSLSLILLLNTTCFADRDNITYYPSGQVHNIGYVDDNNKPTGFWKTYRNDGTLDWTCPYINGLEEGILIFYYSDGAKASEQLYVHGEKSGKRIGYDQINPSIENDIKNITLKIVSNLTTDTDKAKAIYDWIGRHIEYDYHAASHSDFSEYEPYNNYAEATFILRKGICEGYADLYKYMCTYAGIEVIVIKGWAKGLYRYSFNEDANHSWNAIKLNGQWQLVDVTWGSGNGNNWFCVNPEEVIKTHFPEESQWQLLDKPITKEEFIKNN